MRASATGRDAAASRAPGHTADARRRAASFSPRSTADEWLTVDEVCAELKIGRRTFGRWRALGTAPRAVRLAGNGALRIRRRGLEEWMGAGAARPRAGTTSLS